MLKSQTEKGKAKSGDDQIATTLSAKLAEDSGLVSKLGGRFGPEGKSHGRVDENNR